MKTVFVDTNLILRYLLDEPQSIFLEKLLKGKNTLIVPDIVIAEVIWTLGRFYKWPKVKMVSFIVALLKSGNIKSDKNLILSALNIYLKYNVKYTDAYIAALMLRAKQKSIYSFDRDFDKVKSIKRLEP